jgi:hypothetical protein
VPAGAESVSPGSRIQASRERKTETRVTTATIDINSLATGQHLTDMVIAIVAIVIIFGTPVFIVLSILIYKARQTRRLHETVLRLVEKGLPVPTELMLPPPRERSDLRRGVLLIALGLGLGAFFLAMDNSAWSVGAIPLFIGLGYLLSWKLEQRGEK